MLLLVNRLMLQRVAYARIIPHVAQKLMVISTWLGEKEDQLRLRVTLYVAFWHVNDVSFIYTYSFIFVGSFDSFSWMASCVRTRNKEFEK